MKEIEPINQQKLFGLDNYFLELKKLYQNNIYPNKLLLTGPKGIGKSTLAYHFINYVLSINENFNYDTENFEIQSENKSFLTVLNKSNPNLITIDIDPNKKAIDINQIRNLISDLNKTSFNKKPRFVLIDNIEFLNINSINALLKILEEPNENINFILINNNKKIVKTLISRCINYKVSLTNKNSLYISSKLLNSDIKNIINVDFLDYYFTPGNLYHLVEFSNQNNYDLLNLSLRNFLKLIIKNNHYKKNLFMRYIFFQLIESYFRKLSQSFSKNIYDKYTYFLKRISDTKNFNLDEESLLEEFNEEILNG